MKVIIIGAGAAGLAAAKNVLENNFECKVFESQADIGGTWNYTGEVGNDKYGYPIYSAMYDGLRTNLPKDIMAYPDLPIEKENSSYLTQEEVLNYLKLYTDKYNLKSVIKFNRFVTKVLPLKEEKWLVKSIDKLSKIEFEEICDIIIVCNGHYNEPLIPKLEGIEKFGGVKMHSHEYRKPEPFRNQNVVVVGSGPSGIDIALHLSETAGNVYFSHHSYDKLTSKFPENIMQKEDIARILDDKKIEFKDGTQEEVDVIIFCTGYHYSFPFLDKSCAIRVNEDNIVEPIYKQIINIEFPTMGLIGLPCAVCAIPLFDLQSRFYLSFLNGTLSLPSKQEMLEDTKKDIDQRVANGFPRKKPHLMGKLQGKYYEDLSNLGKLEPLPLVFSKIHTESLARLKADSRNFRKDIYKRIDDEHFVRITNS